MLSTKKVGPRAHLVSSYSSVGSGTKPFIFMPSRSMSTFR